MARKTSNNVYIIDGRTNTMEATIPAGTSFGIAVDPDTNRRYVTLQNSLSNLDGLTNKVLTYATAICPLKLNP